MNDITIVGMVAGACYSASYVAPKPVCFAFLAVSTLLVALMRLSHG